MKIIDMHAHIWDNHNVDNLNEPESSDFENETNENITAMLQHFDRYKSLCRIGISPLYGGYYPFKQHIILGNNRTAEYIDRYPDKFFGYFPVNPLLIRNAINEVRRAAKIPHIHGIKIWVACRADKDAIIPTVKECIDHDLPILIHAFYKKTELLAGESTPDHVAILAKKFPQAKIIMAHIGMDWSHAVRVIADFPNISTDFSGSMFERGTIEKAVKYLGADRILFGTDTPTAPLGANLGMLMEAEISHNDRRKIAFDNANELLKLNLNRVSVAPTLLSSRSV